MEAWREGSMERGKHGEREAGREGSMEREGEGGWIKTRNLTRKNFSGLLRKTQLGL